MLRLKSSIVELCQAALAKKLDTTTADWDPRSAVGVVMAAGGYPGDYKKGDIISLPSSTPEGTKVFHAGTKEVDGNVVTAGGRVLCVTALGDSVTQAQQRAYQLLEQVSWKDAYFRTDIAYRAIAREQS
jgi:phosphoribosylamine--glycine ligase